MHAAAHHVRKIRQDLNKEFPPDQFVKERIVCRFRGFEFSEDCADTDRSGAEMGRKFGCAGEGRKIAICFIVRQTILNEGFESLLRGRLAGWGYRLREGMSKRGWISWD